MNSIYIIFKNIYIFIYLFFKDKAFHQVVLYDQLFEKKHFTILLTTTIVKKNHEEETLQSP